MSVTTKKFHDNNKNELCVKEQQLHLYPIDQFLSTLAISSTRFLKSESKDTVVVHKMGQVVLSHFAG